MGVCGFMFIFIYFLSNFYMQVLPSFDTNDSFDYLQIAEFTKECSAKWREMVSGQKKPFDDLAAKDKARYDKEVGLSLCVVCFQI